MSREITTTFHHIPNITGFTWARTPDNVKKLYFEEFRVSFSLVTKKLVLLNYF